MLRASVAVVLVILANGEVASNMNGKPGQYKIANANVYATDYHQNKYFEVYSPVIKTRYSEVYWTMQDPVPLPPEIVKKFANKVMAITGYEVNQVRLDDDGKEAPVPITWAYNHHFVAWLSNSNKTRLVKHKGGSLHRNSHGSDEYYKAELIHPYQDSESEFPQMTIFSEGNGGEFRLSYHGYPKGYAQLIESPDMFQFNPMQIDTWNRDDSSTKFRPGPLPNSSRIPASAGYNGLIECPCSDRIEKEWSMSYALDEGDSEACAGDIENATECFWGAQQVVQAQKHVDRTISDPTRPYGCSIEQHVDASVDAIWNTAKTTGVDVHDTSGLVAFNHAQVNVTVGLDADLATITIVGPNHKWFGVAFGTSTMCIHMQADECPDGGPYAIVVSDNEVTERRLDFHGPGRILSSSVTVVSNSVAGENRTVVLTRPMEGATSNHYTFDLTTRSMPIITARGCGLEFAQHCGHGPSELNFLAVDRPTRICQAGISGTIGGNRFDNEKRCADAPLGDLRVQQNPTCTIQTYRGGLSCCRHGQSLLDKDQAIPWPDHYLEYQIKFRFYYQEYQPALENVRPASHHNLVRMYWMTEAFAGEYDLVQCREGVPPDQCIQVITSRWKVRNLIEDCDGPWCAGKGSTDNTKTEGIELIYAGPHCHAPSCLSMELYNADTGLLLCRVEPIFGETNEVYDEDGFLAMPPCLWGNEEGLAPPELLSLDTTLLSIKRNNNTLPHTGEMASWQMRGIVIPKREGTKSKPPTFKDTMESTADAVRRDQLRRNGN
jgi:hypothetical protein